MWILVLQRLTIEFFLDLLFFPIWWYTGGVKHMLIFCYGLFSGANGYLAPSLWLKNIFTPMFGQHDLQGRIVSFFIRFFNIIFRFIFLVFYLFFITILFLLWFILPFFVILMVILSF